MNDRTVIRPGGKGPKKGNNNSESGYTQHGQSNPHHDDQTVIRDQGSGANQHADRTVIRPGGQTGNQGRNQNSGTVEATRYRDPAFDFQQGNAHGSSGASSASFEHHSSSGQEHYNQQGYQQSQNNRQTNSQPFPDGFQRAHSQSGGPAYTSQYEQQVMHGGGYGEPQAAPASSPQTHYYAPHYPGSRSTNPLIDLVTSLLAIAGKVKTSGGNLDLEELKHYAIRQIQYFQSCKFNLSGDQGLQFKASYGLCCLVDDLVLNTPYSKNSSWIDESLLSIFHKETWGGENFFIFLQEMEETPAAAINVIELYYLAMELGFEGKYREMANGEAQHKHLKQNTYLLLSRYKPPVNDTLSVQWQGIVSDKNTLVKIIPQWVIWFTVIGLSVGVFIIFKIMLAQLGDPVNQRVVASYKGAPIKVIPDIILQDNPLLVSDEVQPDLQEQEFNYIAYFQEFLANEIREGMISVNQGEFGTLLRMNRGDLFASGSASLSDTYQPLLRKIASALDELDVRINVIGHTDSDKINTLQFTSNYALSAARANTVLALMAKEMMNSSRLSAQGVAHTDPIAPNDTEQNKALNRRVDIQLVQ